MEADKMVVEYQYEDQSDIGAYYVSELSGPEKHLWEKIFQFYFNQFGKEFPAPSRLVFRPETEEEKKIREREIGLDPEERGESDE